MYAQSHPTVNTTKKIKNFNSNQVKSIKIKGYPNEPYHNLNSKPNTEQENQDSHYHKFNPNSIFLDDPIQANPQKKDKKTEPKRKKLET